eukprot:SAG31_NODE_101_length_25195_cov_67.436758_11_plen_213_part_00
MPASPNCSETHGEAQYQNCAAFADMYEHHQHKHRQPQHYQQYEQPQYQRQYYHQHPQQQWYGSQSSQKLWDNYPSNDFDFSQGRHRAQGHPLQGHARPVGEGEASLRYLPIMSPPWPASADAVYSTEWPRLYPYSSPPSLPTRPLTAASQQVCMVASLLCCVFPCGLQMKLLPGPGPECRSTTRRDRISRIADVLVLQWILYRKISGANPAH